MDKATFVHESFYRFHVVVWMGGHDFFCCLFQVLVATHYFPLCCWLGFFRWSRSREKQSEIDHLKRGYVLKEVWSRNRNMERECRQHHAKTLGIIQTRKGVLQTSTHKDVDLSTLVSKDTLVSSIHKIFPVRCFLSGWSCSTRVRLFLSMIDFLLRIIVHYSGLPVSSVACRWWTKKSHPPHFPCPVQVNKSDRPNTVTGSGCLSCCTVFLFRNFSSESLMKVSWNLGMVDMAICLSYVTVTDNVTADLFRWNG